MLKKNMAEIMSPSSIYERSDVAGGRGLRCSWCRASLQAPPRMKLGSNVVVMSSSTRLYPHHLGEINDFAAPAAEVVEHPQRPGVWGLRNLTGRPWSYDGRDGRPRTVQPGQSAPIRDGLRLNFGRVQGVLRA